MRTHLQLCASLEIGEANERNVLVIAISFNVDYLRTTFTYFDIYPLIFAVFRRLMSAKDRRTLNGYTGFIPSASVSLSPQDLNYIFDFFYGL